SLVSVVAVGRRALLVTSTGLRLIGERGEELGSTRRRIERPLVAAPSGRLVATEREHDVQVIDLKTDTDLVLDLGERRVRSEAWSPSGRRLALGCEAGEILLLEAP